MSKIFKGDLRTFKSDITGEEREYKVNNAFWIILEDKFGLTQEGIDKEMQNNEITALGKLVTSIMLANDLEVTYEDVMHHTMAFQMFEFYDSFFELYHNAKIPLEEAKELAEQARKAREKK